MCVHACVYESSEASAYSFGLATNPNPTRARGYPLNINPKPDPKPESISGPAGSGRVADLYRKHVRASEQEREREREVCVLGKGDLALALQSTSDALYFNLLQEGYTRSTFNLSALNAYLIYKKHFRGPLAFGGPRQSHTFA